MTPLGYRGSGDSNDEAMDEVSETNIETQTKRKNFREHMYQLLQTKSKSVRESAGANVTPLGYNGSSETNNQAIDEVDEVSEANMETQTKRLELSFI